MEKMDFIICYNNRIFMEECIRYIKKLIVPAGVEIGIITLDDVKSLTSGYNIGMHRSTAKYKVYLHQDVFILNERFIENVLEIFHKDEKIGMIGALGKKDRCKDALYWDAWDEGHVYATGPCLTYDYDRVNGSESKQVVAIDGMIMITQYDVEWREDVFDGFDFYDISQCEEMRKSGYKIVVPYQSSPWCLHDCGNSKFKKFEYYRNIFCDEYKDLGYIYNPNERQDALVEMGNLAERYYEKVYPYLENGNWDIFNALMKNAETVMKYSTNVQIMALLWRIMENEKAQGISTSIYRTGKKIEEYIEEYVKCRFLIRRFEFGKNRNDDVEKVKRYLSTDHGRNYLEILTVNTAFDTEKTMNRMNRLINGRG